MKATKAVIGIMSFLMIMPIRIYLMWYLLKQVEATELPMFIFWASVPLTLIIGIFGEILKKQVK